jgi:hypothetical protein
LLGIISETLGSFSSTFSIGSYIKSSLFDSVSGIFSGSETVFSGIVFVSFSTVFSSTLVGVSLFFSFSLLSSSSIAAICLSIFLINSSIS